MLGERYIVDIKPMLDIEIAIRGQEFAGLLVHHCSHIGWHSRDFELATTKLYRGVTFGSAVNDTTPRQKQYIFVVKDFHRFDYAKNIFEPWANIISPMKPA
jgi:hypothetical protein